MWNSARRRMMSLTFQWCPAALFWPVFPSFGPSVSLLQMLPPNTGSCCTSVWIWTGRKRASDGYSWKKQTNIGCWDNASLKATTRLSLHYIPLHSVQILYYVWCWNHRIKESQVTYTVDSLKIWCCSIVNRRHFTAVLTLTELLSQKCDEQEHLGNRRT